MFSLDVIKIIETVVVPFTHRTLTSARVKWVHLTSRLRSHSTWPVMETWLPSWVTSTSTLVISQNRCVTQVSSCG